MSSSETNRRPQSAGPPVNRINVSSPALNIDYTGTEYSPDITDRGKNESLI